MPTQNGDVLLGRRASFSAPEPAQVSILVYHNFGVDLISTFKVSDSITPVMTKTLGRNTSLRLYITRTSNATVEVSQPRSEGQYEAPDEMATTNTQVYSQCQPESSSVDINIVLPLTQNAPAHVYTQTDTQHPPCGHLQLHHHHQSNTNTQCCHCLRRRSYNLHECVYS